MITVAVVAVVVLLLAVALAAIAIIADVIAPPEFVRRLQERAIVRRSAADQQMQALRAAQELSLLAWKARHDLYDLHSGRHSSRTSPPSRRR